jgi:glutamyl-tRNA(Gln) amidotransferase subunit E
MDEEPPHVLNSEAVDVSLMIALLFKAVTMDEVHIMRKVVIDGSNTTGFQRTSIIALNGHLDVDGKQIPIQQVSLEEDAGRKMGETKNTATFQLDRLGIPLIEITTGPVIQDPEQASKTALAIGRVLRATRKVKRGLGTIRQDLNVSISKGSLIEIKGVQELDLVSKVVELEVKRQLTLLEIRDDLHKRGVSNQDLEDHIVDLTEILRISNSKIIQSALQKGGKVLGLRLKGFNGLLGRELIPNVRLGTEMSKRAGFWGKVGGIFHSDELPAYGIEKPEKEQVALRLECSPNDAFVLVCDEEKSGRDALHAVRDRAKEALLGVPEETRTTNPDGTTSYMRPRPGAARMYPETDVPPVKVTPQRLEKIRSDLPRMQEDLTKELTTRYNIGQKLAEQLVNSDYSSAFEQIVANSKTAAPTYVATVLTESLKNLEREKVPIANLSEEHVKAAFDLVEKGKTAKESVPEILKWLAYHPEADPQSAIQELKLGMLSRTELEEIIRKLVSENKPASIGKLTNLAMSEVRGRADPKLVIQLLKHHITGESE